MQSSVQRSKQINTTPRIDSKQLRTVPLSSSSIMNGLLSGISQYEQKLAEFKNYVQSSVDLNQSIKCRCSHTLSESMTKLKHKFNQFSNEWKNQLPLICKQFMEIVNKICKLYQQQVDRLAGINNKWQFSYQQLLKATGTSTPTQHIKQQSDFSKKCFKPFNSLKPPQLPPTNKPQFPHQMQQNIKIKQHEITLMREQITQLFEEESSFYDMDLIKDQMEDVKEFRLKTSSDQQGNLNNLLNGTGKNGSSFSTKSSQQNSRRNSMVFKEQFWNNLQQNVASGTGKLNKTFQSGKQNINSVTKERLSIPSQKKNYQIKDEQKGKPNYGSGSKLTELKKSLYKNKSGFQNRM